MILVYKNTDRLTYLSFPLVNDGLRVVRRNLHVSPSAPVIAEFQIEFLSELPILWKMNVHNYEKILNTSTGNILMKQQTEILEVCLLREAINSKNKLVEKR